MGKRRTLLLAALLALTLCACSKKQPDSSPVQNVQGQTAGASAQEESPDWQPQYELGVRFLSEDKYEEAIEALTAAIELEPEKPQAYASRGDAHFGLAQSDLGGDQTDAYRSAAQDYEAAMRYGGETDALRWCAANAYYGAQEYEKAASYYEMLIETDEEALMRLSECRRRLGNEAGLADRLQTCYRETGEEKYRKALCVLWPQDVLRGYGALLGTDGTMGFALADLDGNGIPELICGELDTEMSEQPALREYTLYTWRNGQAAELYNGFVDTWINPDVCVTPAGAIVNEGHGTSAGYELQYVRWDGEQIEHHDFWSYAKTEDVSGERAYYLDDAEISEAAFEEQLNACTDGRQALVFLVNTPAICRDYLRCGTEDEQQTEQPQEPQESGQDLSALLQQNLAWLNAVEDELFFVELRGASCMAVVSYENGQYGAIKRLVPEGDSADIEQTLAEGEAIDPAYRSFSPISNYSSKEQILNTLQDYMDVDSLGILQSPYATVSDVLDENILEFDGGLYLVRGGRGYGVYDYDPQTLRVVSSDETACEAECDLLYFEQFDSVQTISFEKRNGRWIIVHVGKAGSSADPYTITAETRADYSLYPRPERTLQQGSQGEDVKYVQALLIVMNYDGVVVDGDFGPVTKAAVMRWQKNHGYTQDGVVDAWTLGEMEAAEAAWRLRQ